MYELIELYDILNDNLSNCGRVTKITLRIGIGCNIYT